MKEVVRISNLHVYFHTQGARLHAVRGVDFSLREEETIAIVGESGCGKSALAKAIVRLLPSHTSTVEGTVVYQGIDLLSLSDKKMQRIRGKEIGMIFQDPMSSLNPTMKIGEQIAEAVERHSPHLTRRQIRYSALEMLKKVGFPLPEERYTAYPHLLSGGLRQRALIALALACHPTLLIADEVTTALDVTIQAQILELLEQMKHEMKMSLLFITHDLSLVARFCDRVLVMYAGKIVEDAPVESLFANPQHPYTRRLLQAIPRLDQPKGSPLIPILGTPPNLSEPLTGCSFCARCDKAMHICTQESPPSMERAADHYASCFLYDKRRKA